MLIIDRRYRFYIPRNKNIYNKTHFKLTKHNPIKTKNKEDPFQFMLILDRERERVYQKETVTKSIEPGWNNRTVTF